MLLPYKLSVSSVLFLSNELVCVSDEPAPHQPVCEVVLSPKLLPARASQQNAARNANLTPWWMGFEPSSFRIQSCIIGLVVAGCCCCERTLLRSLARRSLLIRARASDSTCKVNMGSAPLLFAAQPIILME